MEDRCLCLSLRKPVPLTSSYYTGLEAGRILGVKWSKMLLLIKKKQIKADIDGRLLAISREEILRFAEKNKIFLRG